MNIHTAQKPITISSEHAAPSTNGLYANKAGKGRVKSERYNGWLEAAGWDCKRKGSVHGPYALHIVIGSHTRHKLADLDNKIKCLNDLFVKHQIVDDDKLCEEINIRYGELGAKAWSAIVTPVSWEALP